ncbi:MAG TPA: ABC transporter permease, partial [Blastocatellia bacterium]|nr:ABC transporter permease [Blastocatellia bacterium]
MDVILQDLRYGIRKLAKNPGFTAVVVLALALGIGANTAIFSVVNAILLHPLAFKDPGRIAMVWMDNRKLGVDQDWHSYLNFLEYKNGSQTFEDIAAFNDRSFNLTGAGDPIRVLGAWATASLFPLLGVDPILGRAFTSDEEEPGRDLVVVLSHGLWQRRFGADPQIIGQQISLNGKNRTVIGVMPASFRFPDKDAELWVPLSPDAQLRNNRNALWLKAVGRLKPGVTLEQARADMGTIAGRLEQQYDFMSGYGVNLVPIHDQVVGSVRPALLVLLGAVALVLLIACANVANLLLVRGAAREREIAVRAALGAARGRLVRQMLTESIVLATAGGVAGLLIAVLGLRVLLAMTPVDIPRLDQIRVDWQVLVFALGVSLATGVVFGLVPALQASRPDLNESLKEGGRGSTAGIRGRRIRGALVVSEIALSLILLIGAGLMIKSFVRLQQFNLGFNPDRMLTLRLQLPRSKYKEDSQIAGFYRELLDRVGNQPGVQSAGAISTIFLTKTPYSTNFTIQGRPPLRPGEQIEVPIDSISPNYFRVMGIPLLRGREFTDDDKAGAPGVVMINQTFARRFFPDEDPIGKRFVYGVPEGANPPWLTIVGVVADTRRTGFDSDVRPETYLPYSQTPDRSMYLIVRAASSPMPLIQPVRDEVWAIDKDQPVFSVETMDQVLSELMAQRRFNMFLLAIFAGSALILAAVGVYGVMSYSVTQRTHEIGVRIALGAGRATVLRQVAGQGMMLAAAGIGLGLGGSLALTRLMAGLLFEVHATDPVTFVLIPLLLGGVALAASVIPARRAM